MIRRTVLSVAGMVIIAALSFVYMGHAGLRTGLGEDVYTAEVEVPDTNGLVVGSRVLMRGLEIGEVTDITASAEGVHVSWKYDRNSPIPEDSAIRLDNLSALGEPFLAVWPQSASGQYLPDGAVIGDEKVVVPTTFEELSERLTNLLTQVEPEGVREIFRTLDVALPEDPRVHGNLARSGELMAATFTQNADTFTTILRTLQPLLMDSGTIPDAMRATEPGVAEFGSGFTDLLAGIRFASDRGPLNAGIEFGASPFIGELQKFLDATAADLEIIGVNLLPAVSEAANSIRAMDIGTLLNTALASTESGDALTLNIDVAGR
ncbi:mammalian cell entry protein [Rhodococcus pyridinivorans KG-16]|uniref:Mammalian cell entry protein n=1 Tax=Rhodococcus pyridinivorans KG-16 TaxID=1441730 RepID=A0A0V9UPW5_9NOCA|nr:MlaD family protein [Rhodococcus pyridinivorans]KSZ60032.1 mammalian cell entry protein [Rhodococcus pyridinivorans KG-16]